MWLFSAYRHASKIMTYNNQVSYYKKQSSFFKTTFGISKKDNINMGFVLD
jgi:hypothetical protein